MWTKRRERKDNTRTTLGPKQKKRKNSQRTTYKQQCSDELQFVLPAVLPYPSAPGYVIPRDSILFNRALRILVHR